MTIRLLLRPTKTQTAVEAAEVVPSEIETVRRGDRRLLYSAVSQGERRVVGQERDKLGVGSWTYRVQS